MEREFTREAIWIGMGYNYTYFERIGDVGKGLTIIKMMMMMTVMMIARKIFPGFLFICEDMS